MDYSNLTPVSGEDLYVDEESFGMFGVFGTESGFCYMTAYDSVECEEWIESQGKKAVE